MNIGVNVSIPKKLPIKQLNEFIDKTVYGVAKHTLDVSSSHIPRLSGRMKSDIQAYGVRGSNKTYTLGWSSVKYTPYVWAYPQNTNWTNPSSYAKWFITTFKNKQGLIVSQAVSQAEKVIK